MLFRAHACLPEKLVPNLCKTHAKLVQNSCQIRAKSVPNSCKTRAKLMPNSCQTRTTHYDLLSLNSTHNSLLSQKLCMPERSDRSGNEMPVLFRAHACLRAKTCAKLVQNACKTRAKLLCTRKLVQNSCQIRAKLVQNSCKTRTTHRDLMSLNSTRNSL